VRPRVITAAKDGHIYVADTSARVQKFTQNGKFVTQWRIPKPIANSSEGPEGIAALKDGSIAVTNTHAQTVLIYSPQGKLLRQWGTYGTKPGQFLLVTGLCVDSDGNIFTADYGGQFDRIQKWTPQGKLLAAWPGHGSGPRQFRRPCGLAISKDGDLLVADIAIIACSASTASQASSKASSARRAARRDS
jgi:DNA-binding beta-propeller fold protein YncE